MTFLTDNVQSHYDTFLARHYLWMAGGFEKNIRRNKEFFVSHGITPSGTRVAVDLGAGCGFQTFALASAGFDVVAVDFCRPLLDILALNANNWPVRIIPSDILAFSAWANLSPELIVCMGDTLTHLPGHPR
jgi:2-polyprenyl-3-methyl-5-hydroxy-6-metoxy-1,4-benzoquinol methylase